MRVLLLVVCVLLGSVSCVVGDNSSDAKGGRQIGQDTIDRMNLIKVMCGHSGGFEYRPLVRISPEEDIYYIEKNNWSHPNKNIMLTMAAMLDSEEDDSYYVPIFSREEHAHIWIRDSKEGSQSVIMSGKAIEWFTNNESMVKCNGFKYGFPVFSFPDFILSEASPRDTRSRFWHFIGLSNGNLAFINPSYPSETCSIDSCYKASLLIFDSQGNVHSNFSGRMIEGRLRFRESVKN